MSFRAAVAVLLGGNYGAASRLLASSERGEDAHVKEILQSRPQLAAYMGFHGTSAPLHRAAAGGHLTTCKVIVELIKLKAEGNTEEGASGTARGAPSKRWASLLRTVLNQRNHKGQTALMLACEAGHVAVVSFLLTEGADPLAFDVMHSRTALHYAACGGHSACVRVLCADTTQVEVGGTLLPLRDVVSQDLLVGSAKYVDRRSMGGLTALHFAAVSGSLPTLQALLNAGASIMVKTAGQAFIGREYLTPGSTPLHIAVLVGSMPLAHALLQAHANMMMIMGGGRDERRRRAWEGHSRSDIRSVRNTARKLPYHLARDRGWSQMMQLVDPRVPVDAALDAARDQDEGIGPKCLATICSIVLQQSLLQWLDRRQTELQTQAENAAAAAERERRQQAAAGEAAVEAGVTVLVSAASSPGKTSRQQQLQKQSPAVVTDLPPLPPLPPSPLSPSPSIPAASRPRDIPVSPFAAAARALEAEDAAEYRHHQQEAQQRQHLTASAPVTPQEQGLLSGEMHESADPCSAPPAMLLGLRSMGSLHGYLSILSVRRPAPSPPSLEGSEGALLSSSDAHLGGSHRRATLSLPVDGLPIFVPQNSSVSGGAAAGQPRPSRRRLVRPMSTGELLRLSGGGSDGSAVVTVLPGAANGTGNSIGVAASARRALSTLRDRLKSPGEVALLSSGPHPSKGPGARELSDAVAVTDPKPLGSSNSDDGTGCCSLSDAEEPPSEDKIVDQECGVCLDQFVEVAFSGCEHALCLECARNLTKQEKKPPTCPFCRRMVVGFMVPGAQFK